MSLTFSLNNSSQRALDTAILGCVRDAVEFLADKHGFSCEEALQEMNLVKSAPVKKPTKEKVLKATIPLRLLQDLQQAGEGQRERNTQRRRHSCSSQR